MFVVQYGCIGTRNYGDEVSAIIIRRMLRSAYPGVSIVMVGADKRFIKKHHADVTDYATQGEKDKIRAFCEEADLMVYGAGTILTGNLLPMALDMQKWMRGPVVVWGVGCSGVQKGSDGLAFAKKALLVGVRDHSIDSLKALGVKQAVSVPDPIFVESKCLPKKHHAISVSWGLTRLRREDIEHALAELAKFVDTRRDRDWVAIPAAWDGESVGTFDDDRLLHEELAKRCSIRVVTPSSYEDMKDLVAQSDILIASRLHIGVLGYVSGADTYWIGPPKNNIMAASLGSPGRFLGDYMSLDLDRIGTVPLPDTSKLATTLESHVGHFLKCVNKAR